MSEPQFDAVGVNASTGKLELSSESESNVDKAERTITFYFRRFVKNFAESEREDVFHGAGRKFYVTEFARWLEEQGREMHEP